MSAPRVMLWPVGCLAALGFVTGVRAGPGVPPDFQAIRVIRTVEPRYPEGLISRGIFEGEARVVVLVDAEGHLADWLLTSFSHPLVAQVATEAVPVWRYEPAQAHGLPIIARAEVVFSFHASGLITSVTTNDATGHLQPPRVANGAQRIWPVEALDEPISVVKSVRPGPLDPAEIRHQAGRVVVDFYIDQEGRPRLLVVTQADDEEFAQASLTAMSLWKFSVPVHQGTPVITHAAQEFKFQLPD